MARIVICGAGLAGLGTALLLADDGHQVVVVERDPAPAPRGGAEDAWERWDRRGVAQFRQLHLFLARFREILEVELPAAALGLDAVGALRLDLLGDLPETVAGTRQPGDERFVCLTARRPVIEAVLASAAEDHPGVEVRRGQTVVGLLPGPPAVDDVPHAVGVRTEQGEDLPAGLVIDASGRRSPLSSWLAALGAAPPRGEVDEPGYVYYCRWFRSRDGRHPAVLGPTLQHFGSISILTLPADNGTWAVGVVTSGRDTWLRGLRDPHRWTEVVRAHPEITHWLNGEPMQDRVWVMTGLEDRRRPLVSGSQPAATGVLAVGDSWACTNPSLGRDATIAMLHAVVTRDVVGAAPVGEPLEATMAHHDATKAVVEPWHRSTRHFDRHRLAEMEAHIDGRRYETDDERWHFRVALARGAESDPELLRAAMAEAHLFRPLDDLLGDEHLAARVRAVGGSADAEPAGPSRRELVALAAG